MCMYSDCILIKNKTQTQRRKSMEKICSSCKHNKDNKCEIYKHYTTYELFNWAKSECDNDCEHCNWSECIKN